MPESCYHCGQEIDGDRIIFDEKAFCCNGCKSVYEILNVHRLGNFYEMNKNAGTRPDAYSTQFDYLDTPEIFEKVTDFSEGGTTLVTFKIPVIHCSSCIWLLESLHTLHQDINYAQVHFTRKTVQISYRSDRLKLGELAKFLTDLGYKPVINLETADRKEDGTDKSLLIKLAVAGFAFGNGMFFSYPEYAQELLGSTDFWMEKYKYLFRLLMFLLATPVAFYSASDYFKSAWYGMKNKVINIDVPIVLGILMLYGRSLYEIITNYGPGYFDTLCGLIFFMLLGKFFQKRTYGSLSYDRDYKSFYPIAVTRLDAGRQKNILLSDLKIGDRILVRNQEIIPVDAVLIGGVGNIDNSFITGESALVAKNSGDRIFAGGRQNGSALELEVIKNVDQSYLTQLWNKEAFKKSETGLDTLTNKISKYFTIVILSITVLAALYWSQENFEKMFQVVSAILIVACPCALALSAPFTMGHVMRIFGRNQFYVKDTLTIEKLAKIDTLVFDKTGTITRSKKSNISYDGLPLNDRDLMDIKSLLKHSAHPLSRSLYEFLPEDDAHFPTENFRDFPGEGYEAEIRGSVYRIGSKKFAGSPSSAIETAVSIAKDGQYLGRFIFKNEYRQNISKMFSSLAGYGLYILSGDNASEESALRSLAPQLSGIFFNQSPEDKLNFIKNLQDGGKRAAMFGDGLNDAGALKQSDVGIAVADDTNAFTPGCDVIISGNRLAETDKFLRMSKDAVRIVKAMFIVSFLYNLVGLGFAVTGRLSPLVCAILMPVSSISVVAATSALTWLRSLKYFKI